MGLLPKCLEAFASQRKEISASQRRLLVRQKKLRQSRPQEDRETQRALASKMMEQEIWAPKTRRSQREIRREFTQGHISSSFEENTRWKGDSLRVASHYQRHPRYFLGHVH